MSAADVSWAPESAFAGLDTSAIPGNGVVVRPRDGFGLATLIARKGAMEGLNARIRDTYGVSLPRGPGRVTAGAVSFIGTGPQTWLALHDDAGNAFAASLKQTCGTLASIGDQSDGYGLLRLSGPRVRDALCKLVSVDLDETSFSAGDAAVTSAAHIGVVLWRLTDEMAGTAVFEMAAYRSYMGSLWHAVRESAGEFGLTYA